MALPKIKDMTDAEIAEELACRREAIQRKANIEELRILRKQCKEESE